jgi:hypothetical protein
MFPNWNTLQNATFSLVRPLSEQGYAAGEFRSHEMNGWDSNSAWIPGDGGKLSRHVLRLCRLLVLPPLELFFY